MPLINIPDHRSIPRLDEPATVVGFQVIVGVQCKCGSDTVIGLMNAQPAACEGCGAVFSLDAAAWDKGSPTPRVSISAAPSRAQTLMQ